MRKKLLCAILVLAMVLGMIPSGVSAFADTQASGTVSAVVNYTAQAEGGFLEAPKYGVTVSSGLAEQYDYADNIDKSTNVSALDVLVQAHIDIFGEAFTIAAKDDYLSCEESAYGITITKLFGVKTMNCGFAVNGGYPNDGTESSFGGYNGTTIGTQAIANGDTVDFFIYQDQSYWSDAYSYLKVTDTDSGEACESYKPSQSLTLSASGVYYVMGYLYKTPADMKAAADALEGIGFSWVDAKTGELTELKGSDNQSLVSDDQGKAVITAPAEAGTYYITASGTDDTETPVVMNPVKIVVAGAPTPEPEPAKSIIVKAAPKEVSVAFYNADGSEALASERVTDNGIVDNKYHQYTLEVPAGDYVFKGTEGSTDIGGGTLTIGADTADKTSFTIVRTNFYSNVTGITETGAWTLSGLKNSVTGKPCILGPQYVNSAKIYQPTMLIGGVAYNGGAVAFNDARFLEDFYLKDFSSQTVSATAYTVQNKALPIARYNTFTVTAPTDAAAKFYNQAKNYVVSPMSTAELSSTDNGDGTTTYSFKSKTTTFNSSYSYRFSKDGKLTQAGYMSNNGTAVVTFPEDKTPSEGNSALDYDDRSILLNITQPGDSTLTTTNELRLSANETFTLRAFRGPWEIIDTTTNNKMIEPDFHYEVIEGSDVVSVSPIANDYETGKTTGNAKDNWATIKALKAGTALIKVWYDAININGSNVANGIYGATDPARYGIVTVKVGDSSTLDWKPLSIDGNWDSEFDTVYFEGESGIFKCQPSGVTSMSVCNICGDTMTEWKTVSAGVQGIYNVPVTTGANVIKAVTAKGTSFMVVRARKLDITIKNNTTNEQGTSANPPAIKVGDSVTISFDKLDMPVPKMSGVYNPGYLGTAKTAYTLNDNLSLFSKGVQYNYTLNENSCITFTALAAGANSLTNGYINLSSMGDPFGNHRRIDENGKAANLNAGEVFDKFGLLPNVSFNVADNAEFDYAAQYDDTVALTTSSSKTVIFFGASTYNNAFSIANAAPGSSSGTKTWGKTTEQIEAQTGWSLNAKVTSPSNFNTIDLKYWYEGEAAKIVRLENGVQKTITDFVADASKKLYLQIIVTPADSRIGGAKEYPAYVVNAKSGSGSASGSGSGSEGGSGSGSESGSGSGAEVGTDTTIKVNVRVLGDSEHGDKGSCHTLSRGGLTTWYSGTVELSSGSTVSDALAAVEADSELVFHYSGSNYISGVSYKGTSIYEFSNGMNSGWMYTLNGSHPNLGVAEQLVSNGDRIVFHYTDDYTIEEGSEYWNSGSSSDSDADTTGEGTAAAGEAAAEILDVDPTDTPAGGEIVKGEDDAKTALPKSAAAITADNDTEVIQISSTPKEAAEASVKKGGSFYDESGEKLTETFVNTPAGKLVYVDEEGKKVKNTVISVKDEETGKAKNYYTNNNGVVVKNKLVTLSDGTKIFAGKDGAIATKKLVTAKSGKSYYADKNGVIVKEKIVAVGGKKYYAGKSGTIVKDKVFTAANGKQYVATEDGSIAKSCWIEMNGKLYYCNKNGVVTKSKNK